MKQLHLMNEITIQQNVLGLFVEHNNWLINKLCDEVETNSAFRMNVLEK